MPPKKRKAEVAADDVDGKEWSGGELSDADTFKKLENKFSLAGAHQKQRYYADGASGLFKNDQIGQPLKPDHANRPMWVVEDGKIILESFSPLFPEAQDFLINIAEPISRVSRMHEYTLTAHSLFAAVSVGHNPEEIINRLEKYSKAVLSSSVVNFIKKSSAAYGKAKIVLKKTLSYIESDDPALLRQLLQDPVISSSLADSSAKLITEAAPKLGGMMIPGTKMAAGANQVAQPEPAAEESQAPNDMIATLREDDEEEEEEVQVHSFQIRSETREAVIKQCWEIGYPLTQEYDFNNDTVNPNLDIDLKPHAQIRYYQEKALSKMFSNSRARSGVIVLPCGAGKTLVGITAACGVKKSCIVLCNSTMSALQWRAEFLKWSNINQEDIAVLTSLEKNVFPHSAGILVTTYHMLAASGKRAHDTAAALKFIQEREWGLLIADEVHIIPAAMFKKVTYSVASHCKLGLTATLLREDDKIGTLNFLVGPKLYEANWQELSQQGHIAKVQCAEVWCRMTPEFYQEWLNTAGANSPKKQLLAVLNPYKFQACQFLIDYHAKRGDKIIVFSDNVYALEKYALKLVHPYIHGGTSQGERLEILENFQHNERIHTVFLSKIGDTSLDLPEATCLIQISSHYGSRRQEAQRLGRILRAKRRNDEGFNAFFYSLVSKDTDEMSYAARRQTFLVDQGYAFKIITKLEGIENRNDLFFRTLEDRKELLTEVCLAKESDAAEERIAGDTFSMNLNKRKKGGARRTAGTLADLSGGAGMSYIEYNKSKNKELTKSKGVKNSFIRKLNSSHANAKKKKATGE
ncbi:DNA repair helicase RAD25 [Didymosphaeria variabile]|uniref:DNA 3'-5' helicase n=1 Tax=Didymosphaeria variabile TaxID=1932322 RepID=A0A9W9C7H5_9PLEO|nr:DNA repair helicase RAD25 [Didymosphaeria variabile]KAJ4346867.1 DNA repair helicase RAD25 [Didymosphaeria variabile]